MQNPQQVVILGHSGFIGSYLEEWFSRNALNYTVVGKSLPEADLSDFEQVLKLATYFTSETTVILAAAVKRQFGDTLEIYRKNMAIVENVCELLQKHAIKRMIFMSSAAVYGEETHNVTISEMTPVHPTSFYGIAKFAGECLLRRIFAHLPNSSLICLRPPLIYGPRDKGSTYGPVGFASAASAGKAIKLWGDGEELREFLYIEDLCRIMNCLLNSNFHGTLNIASGRSYTYAHIIAILRTSFPDLKLEMQARSKNKVDNGFDATRLLSFLPSDFKFTDIKEGIFQTLQTSH